MIRMILAAASISILAAPTFAATQCRDAKGHFAPCSKTTSVKTVTTVTSPAVTKDAKGKCHIASGPKRGQFIKCPGA